MRLAEREVVSWEHTASLGRLGLSWKRREKMEQVGWRRPSLLCAFALSGCHKLCSHACTVMNRSHKPKSIAPLSKLWHAFCQRWEYAQRTSHQEWPGKHGLVLCVNSTVSEYLVDSHCFFSFTSWFLRKSQWLQFLSPSCLCPMNLVFTSTRHKQRGWFSKRSRLTLHFRLILHFTHEETEAKRS